jgi:hypothetical protein
MHSAVFLTKIYIYEKKNKLQCILLFYKCKMSTKLIISFTKVLILLIVLILHNEYSLAFSFAPLSTASVSVSTTRTTVASSSGTGASSSNSEIQTLSSSSIHNTTASNTAIGGPQPPIITNSSNKAYKVKTLNCCFR